MRCKNIKLSILQLLPCFTFFVIIYFILFTFISRPSFPASSFNLLSVVFKACVDLANLLLYPLWKLQNLQDRASQQNINQTNKTISHSVLFVQLLLTHIAIFMIMTEDYSTWTGVEKMKSSKFSHDRPGMIQHISAWLLCCTDICTMKYVMISMLGTPNTNDTRNAIRHFLISSLE